MQKSPYFIRTLPGEIIEQEEVDVFTRMILEEAEKLGVSWEVISDTNFIELTYKNNTQRFCSSSPNTSTFEAVKCCGDKHLCKIMLKRGGIEVMPGFVIYESDTDDRIRSIWETLQKPLVLKPARGGHGDGVEVGLSDFADCLKKIRHYFSSPLYQGGLILEEMFFGKEYRILVAEGRVLAVTERVPSYVVGDGNHTVSELIKIENDKPIRNNFFYPHISVDETSVKLLNEQNLTLDSCPQKDQHVRLKQVCNITAGGVSIDRTDEIHDSVKDIAIKAAQAIPGLNWVGIDFITKDIFAPQSQGTYVIIEMNSAPEFGMHDIPMQGKSRGVAKELICIMFPELR